MSIRRSVPSLNALVVLEAAARHRSFTSAGVELGVTQAAVSRQVAMLEEELAVQLFTRRHRAIEPTTACELLAASLAMSFATIADSVEMVRLDQRQEVVTIGATLAFSSLWLLPHLGEFRKRYPSTQIRVVSQDARFNLNSGEVDLIVRYGSPPFQDGVVVASRTDEVFPVCSPNYASRVDDFADAVRHARCELIAHDVPERSWYGWQDWFARAGLAVGRPEPALRFNHYSDALQAARSGHGVALGWGVLVQRDLLDGSLVRLGGHVLASEGRYNIVVPVSPRLKSLPGVLAQWLAGHLCA